MNRKILFSVVSVFSIVLLAACTSAVPAPTSTGETFPSSTNTTNANTAEPTLASDTAFTTAPSNLA